MFLKDGFITSEGDAGKSHFILRLLEQCSFHREGDEDINGRELSSVEAGLI